MKTKEKKPTPREKILEEFKSVLKEDGVMPWEQPWENTRLLFQQRNGFSDRKYSGVNQLLLSIIAMKKNYQDPRWVTFKQAKDLGGTIKMGEHGQRLELWKFLDNEEWKKANEAYEKGKLKSKPKYGHYLIDQSEVVKRCKEAGIAMYSIDFDSRFFLTDCSNYLGAVVFNACQCKGLPELEKPQKHEFSISEVGLKLIDNYSKNTNLKFIEGDAIEDGAFYRPSTDQVFVPSRTDFKTEEGFLSTCFHEIGHSTMAPHRLNRPEAAGNDFGSASYAIEELRAEISSVIVCSDLGITPDKMEKVYQVGEAHKAYVQSWLEAIDDKPNAIINAFKDAEKIGDYVEEKGGLPELIQEFEVNEVPTPATEKSVEKEIHGPKLSLNGVSGSLTEQLATAVGTAEKNSLESLETEPTR